MSKDDEYNQAPVCSILYVDCRYNETLEISVRRLNPENSNIILDWDEDEKLTGVYRDHH